MILKSASMQGLKEKFFFFFFRFNMCCIQCYFGLTCAVSSAIFALIPAKVNIAKVKKTFQVSENL